MSPGMSTVTLVLNDAYYPGWKATINGQPADIFPAYYAFRGLILPPGQHTIEFRYRPASFTWGVWISGVSLLVLLGAVASEFLIWRKIL